jgi:hypothetical protein
LMCLDNELISVYVHKKLSFGYRFSGHTIYTAGQFLSNEHFFCRFKIYTIEVIYYHEGSRSLTISLCLLGHRRQNDLKERDKITLAQNILLDKVP